MFRIGSFRGKYDFLSNFHAAPIEIRGVLWPTVEHAFQAAKSLKPEEHEYIRKLDMPSKAKKAGRKVTLRSDWEKVKLSVMRYLVFQKFAQNPALRNQLLATGERELVEGNTWHDQYWGSCICEKCIHAPGQNQLGKILMEVRKVMRESK